MDILNHIINTPYFLQALGWIISIAILLGSLIYNGDLSLIKKVVLGVGGYAFFVGLMDYFHLAKGENKSADIWLQPIGFLLIIFMAYSIGLIIGVLVHWYIHKRK